MRLRRRFAHGNLADFLERDVPPTRIVELSIQRERFNGTGLRSLFPDARQDAFLAEQIEVPIERCTLAHLPVRFVVRTRKRPGQTIDLRRPVVRPDARAGLIKTLHLLFQHPKRRFARCQAVDAIEVISECVSFQILILERYQFQSRLDHFVFRRSQRLAEVAVEFLKHFRRIEKKVESSTAIGHGRWRAVLAIGSIQPPELIHPLIKRSEEVLHRRCGLAEGRVHELSAHRDRVDLRIVQCPEERIKAGPAQSPRIPVAAAVLDNATAQIHALNVVLLEKANHIDGDPWSHSRMHRKPARCVE